MSGGTITRKDLITDEGLEFGKEYAKNIEIAIEANKELIESAKALTLIASQYQKVANTQQLTALKQQETLEATKAMNAIKLETEALKAAEKVKQESLRTRKLELDAMAKEEAAKKRNTKLTIEERVELEANNKALKQAAREKLGLVGAYDKLNAKRTEAKNRLRDLIAVEGESSKSVKIARKEFEELDKKVKKADDAVRDFTKNVGNYPKLNQFTGGIRNLIGAFGLVGGIGATIAVIKSAAQTVREYEAEVVNLAAIAGKTRKEIQPLEAEIRNVAKSSVNSATEVAKLATELIKLGSTEEEAKLLLKPINDLSVALRASAEDSATLVKSLLNTFGEGADQASRYTDVLAASANYTALGFNELRDSMSYIAPVANAMGYSIEQTAAMVGVLADNGIKAESAGRLLRTMMGNAAKEGTTLEKQLQKVASSTDKVKTATTLFGAEGASLGIILANNKDRVAELTKEFENSKGSLEELTNKQLQSVDSQLKILDSTWQEFILSIENGDGAISRFFVKGIKLSTQLLEKFIELNKSVEDKSNDYFKSLEERYSESKKASDQYYQDEFDKNEKIYKNQLRSLETLEKKLAIEKETFNYKYLANRKEATDIQKQIDLLNEQIKLTELSQAKIKSKIETDKTYRANLEQEYAILFTSINKQVTSQQALDYARGKSTKRLQEEIDMLKKKNTTGKEAEEIDKKAAAEAEKRRANQLSKMKQADDDEFALLKFRAERNISISDEIADNETESIETRIDAYLLAQQIETSLAEQTAAYKLRAISQYNDEVRDLTNAEIQTLINGGQIKKQLTKDEVLVLEQLNAQKEDLDKKDLANRQKIVDSIVEIENKKIASLLKLKDTELNNKLIKENEYFKEELKALQGNQQAIEDATKDHEARVQKIKEDSAKQALQTQIDAQRKLLENSKLSADVRAEIENKLSKLELELNQIGVDSALKSNEEKLKAEQEYSEKIKDIANQLKDAIIDLTNSIFDAKIQSIDNEIARNEEYYSRQLELAGNDQAQKDLIQQEAEKKRKKLEDEKRKEQQKQAIFNKVMQASQVSISTIGAVMSALRDVPKFDFGISASALAATYATIGAAQLAAVLATPIPKYEKGTKGKPHKGGPALVGEKRAEVIQEPGMNPYVIDRPTILNLKKGTEVTPSIDEWNRIQRASIMASLGLDFEKAKSFETQSNPFYDMQQLEDKIENGIEKGFRKARITINNNQQGFDLEHELWKLRNMKWN